MTDYPAISTSENVAILGASTNPARYSHMAQLALLEQGHIPVPVNPRYTEIDDIRCYPDLGSIPVTINTVTVYVRPEILTSMAKDLIQTRPARVIFNPGSESREVSAQLEAEGIHVLNACTLVLLSTSSFA